MVKFPGLLLLIFPFAALAESGQGQKSADTAPLTLAGRVRVVGSAYASRVVLAEEGGFKGPKLCRSEVSQKVGRLSGMTVKVTGAWINNNRGNPKCFDANTFTVIKTAAGRAAVVGILTKTDRGYVITGESGAKTNLQEVPSGLKKLKGQKVIIDLKVMGSEKAKVHKIVSYSQHP